MDRNGYAWWYVDALSDDGRHGLTIIAFVGSVFSPFYARARARGHADPLDHCALNVALYGPVRRWAFTERRRDEIDRDRSTLGIGPNTLHWDGNALTIRIDEIAAPVPRRIRGVVRIVPETTSRDEFTLSANGMHRWRPIAPCARAEVNLSNPGVRWSGVAYLDSNRGETPIEDAFSTWTWSRMATRRGAAVLYDVVPRGATPFSLGLQFDAGGGAADIDAPACVAMPATRWRVRRETRADAHAACAVVRTFEDTPFYARTLISTRLGGETGLAVHESLSLDRFRTAWVQRLLPFRMRRT